ncbi:MAG: oligosaccharide flippase family protein [Parvibaculaceae bacterium]
MKRSVGSYFEENKPFAGLGRASLRSGVIFVTARGINIFVQLASTVVLARLLSPDDFGLVAMVLALIGFAPLLIDFGTTDASVQKTHIGRDEISTLFWFNLATGIGLTVLLIGTSGWIARLFGEPALTQIAMVLSLTFIMTALSTQHYALMRRAMQFRRLAMIDISANVVGSVVSIVMALTDWGYWSLAAKPIVTSGLTVIAAWLSCPWVPGRPRFTPAVRELLGFGFGVTGFTMTDYVAKSADRLVIGYFYGAGPLGYFQNAFNIYSNLLSIMTESLHNVAVAGLSKLRDNIEELKRSWTAALSSLSFFSAGTFSVLAVTAQDFVVILLGQKWAPAGALLCIVAVRGIAHSVERTLGWLHVASGQAVRWRRGGCLSAACQLIALLAGLPFGITGIAIAYAIAMFGLFVPALVYAGRPLGIGSKDVLRAVGPQTVAALATVAVGFLAQHVLPETLSPLPRFAASVPICTAVYLALAVGVFGVTEPLRIAFRALRDFSPVRWRAVDRPQT